MAAPLRNLVILKQIAKDNGIRVSEAYPEGRPTPGAHKKTGYHYKTGIHAGVVHSLAADFNYGPAGIPAEEKAKLAFLYAVGESLGVAVIHDITGRGIGSAGSHRTHLHADTGNWSNRGNGPYPAKSGDPCAWDTQGAIRAVKDNLAGTDTLKRLEALRAASNLGGVRFPYGVAFTQNVVGTTPDNDWGPKSRAAHDDCVGGVEQVWKAYGLYDGGIDDVWGRKMEAAYKTFVTRYGR